MRLLTLLIGVGDLQDKLPNIDWTKFTWPVSDTCTCINCSTCFRSHAKATYGGKGLETRGIWSREPCPNCGSHRLSKIESDPELWKL